MEGLGAMEEFGLVQQQIHTHIPGTTDVQTVLPWREETNGNVKYEQFTDGVVMRRVNNVMKKCQETTVIRKTVTEGNTITRFHTIAYWEDRETATYVPICQSLKAAGLRMESRLFE